MTDSTDYSFSFEASVEQLPGIDASAAFVHSDIHFREEKDIVPRHVGDIAYMPWGNDNCMPYRIIDSFEEDETLSACSGFQAETLYASGLVYSPPEGALFSGEIEDFFENNDMSAYFLGVCRDIKMFEFAVSVLIISDDGLMIENVFRKEACYCRFPPAEPDGSIRSVLYANWRMPVTSPDQIEVIPLADSRFLFRSISEMADAGHRKIAVVTRLPGVDSMYYPIPAYASIFRGKWYNIKRFIGIAKEAKLKNSAPIKYLIEVSSRYWEQFFREHHVTDPAKKQALAVKFKQEMVDFLTGARNSGKAMFTSFEQGPDGKELHHVKVTKIEDDKEGGDWASDHAEAINMLCFAMRVHSNLVGSVPGKAQSNNSGSDKRELYIIAQALQKPYRDCLFMLHKAVIRFNSWKGTTVSCPLLQLTTLDEHRDIKTSEPASDHDSVY